jgi:hypothetical protein
MAWANAGVFTDTEGQHGAVLVQRHRFPQRLVLRRAHKRLSAYWPVVRHGIVFVHGQQS